MVRVRMMPAHPGEFIRTEVIDPLNLSVTSAAEVLGVSRVALSNLLNGKADLSIDMVVRVQKAFGVSAATLLRMQAAYNIARAEKRSGQINVRRYRAA